jgi:hypothetical protein
MEVGPEWRSARNGAGARAADVQAERYPAWPTGFSATQWFTHSPTPSI